MRTRLIAISIILLLLPGLANASPAPKTLMRPSDIVARRTQAQWADSWWQWAYRFPRTSGPIADLTGEDCELAQEGPVWFLAGTYESRPIHRCCTVPMGKFIFFPIINYVASWRNVDAETGCDMSQNTSGRLTDPALRLTVELDGVAVRDLKKYRQASQGCFNLAGANPDAQPVVAASNGYWVMLKPLAPGHHTLRFGAVLPTLQQGVIYDLEVEGSST